MHLTANSTNLYFIQNGTQTWLICEIAYFKVNLSQAEKAAIKRWKRKWCDETAERSFFS